MHSVKSYFYQLGKDRTVCFSLNKSAMMRYSTKMKILSSCFVVLSMLSFSAIPTVSARANQQVSDKGLISKPKSAPFTVCIDDSDCMKIGGGTVYACFQYVCYPWKDDSKVAPKERYDLCRKDSDCKGKKKCYRHADKRTVNKGLCMDELQECGVDPEDGKCPKGKGCCDSVCCEKKFYDQYKNLPCQSHLGCEDLGLGKFCCPKGKGNDSVCCNTDPNPPPAAAAPAQGKGAATSANTAAFTSSLVSTAIFFLLM